MDVSMCILGHWLILRRSLEDLLPSSSLHHQTWTSIRLWSTLLSHSGLMWVPRDENFSVLMFSTTTCLSACLCMLARSLCAVCTFWSVQAVGSSLDKTHNKSGWFSRSIVAYLAASAAGLALDKVRTSATSYFEFRMRCVVYPLLILHSFNFVKWLAKWKTQYA